MKKTVLRILSVSSLVSLMAIGTFVSVKHLYKGVEKADAYDTATLPTTIDLNDTPEATIRSYYSSLDSLPESERKGSNLLKNLKPILKNGQKYESYDTDSNGRRIWQIYEIADRDWTKSPASEISGYNSSTNKITGYSYGTSASSPGTNPYIRALYVNRSVDNNVRAWAQTGTTSSSHGNNAEWCIDREHIWQKSQGFEGEGRGGARGDPMHLWPGDSDVNSSLHNDQFYGFVNITSGTKAGRWSYAKDNYVGDSLTLGAAGSANYVFEPQDSDKGDIARAIFYMVARYNYLSGEDSDGIDSNNPNLELAQINVLPNAYTSSTTTTGKMGVMTDLLQWHHLDPVDEFEIHRNNLLYTNYTNNRNPFIDFPEWVDYIWGTAEYSGRNYQSYNPTPTGNASPSTDTINGYNPIIDKEVIKLEVTKMPNKTEYYVGESFDKTGMVVTATLEDNSTMDVTSYVSCSVDTSSVGEKIVTISFQGKSATITINVIEKPVPWYDKIVFANVKVWYLIAIGVGVVVLIGLVIGLSTGILKVNKKGKVKVSKSGVKKAVKGSKKK